MRGVVSVHSSTNMNSKDANSATALMWDLTIKGRNCVVQCRMSRDSIQKAINDNLSEIVLIDTEVSNLLPLFLEVEFMPEIFYQKESNL